MFASHLKASSAMDVTLTETKTLRGVLEEVWALSRIKRFHCKEDFNKKEGEPTSSYKRKTRQNMTKKGDIFYL